jgi:hypothetical protein
MRYATERLLYRPGESEWSGAFVLKGATLFALWGGEPHRPTRDLDLLAHGDPDVDRWVGVLREICDQPVENDGIEFSPDSATGERVRDEERYEGVRLRLTATLGTARIRLRIDLGFGDVVTPKTGIAELPTLLSMPAPRLWTYPRETVVAEKFGAMVDLGMRNSRVKDFYDLWYLVTHFDFDGALLLRALAATFQRRGTPLASGPPTALTADFYGDPVVQVQWNAFIGKSRLAGEALALDAVVGQLRAFLMPLLLACHQDGSFGMHWNCTDERWQPRA